MIVLCNGMPRSASTWSFNVCRRLLQMLRPEASLCARYHENIAETIDLLAGSYDHVGLKCHFLDARGRELCSSGRAAVIYTYRDAYDAICSLMVMFGQSFEEALDAVRRSLELRELHRQHGGAHMIDYESIRQVPVEAICALAKYLQLEARAEVVRQIAEETSFEAMKNIAGRVSAEQGAIRTPRSMYDPETCVHRNHIRDGRSGYGRERLSAEQSRRVEEVLGGEVRAAV